MHNGPIIRNLHELEKAIENMDTETYKHHAYEERNDFENWVRDVVKDEELAHALSKCRSQQEMFEKLRNKIKFVERVIDKERLKSSNPDKTSLPYSGSYSGIGDALFSKYMALFIFGIIIGAVLGIAIEVKFSIF